MNSPDTLARSSAAACEIPTAAWRFADDDAGIGPAASLIRLMKRIVSTIEQQGERDLGERGFSGAQWSLLMTLHRRGPSTVLDLARECRIDSGSMTRRIDMLEKKKLCLRQRSTADRRVAYVELTTEGRAVAKKMCHLAPDAVDAHLAGFTMAERDALRDYLRRMVDAGAALRDRTSPLEKGAMSPASY